MKPLYPFILLGILFLASCVPPAPSDKDILATADAIRSRTPIVEYNPHEDAEQTATAYAIDAIVATDLAQLTKEAEALATEEAEFLATMEVIDATSEAGGATYIAAREATEEAEFWATEEAFISEIVATDFARLTAEAASGDNCVIKGNVSQVPGKEGERIYHMPSDEFYDETVVNPRYGERYFCTPEAAGFRRAYN